MHTSISGRDRVDSTQAVDPAIRSHTESLIPIGMLVVKYVVAYHCWLHSRMPETFHQGSPYTPLTRYKRSCTIRLTMVCLMSNTKRRGSEC